MHTSLLSRRITDLFFNCSNWAHRCTGMAWSKRGAVAALSLSVAAAACNKDDCEGGSCADVTNGDETGGEDDDSTTLPTLDSGTVDPDDTDAGSEEDPTEQRFVECDAGAANLPISDVAAVTPSCATAGVGGWWYCFEDGVNPSSCVQGELPYDEKRSGLCLSGETSYDPEYVAFGAGIGVTLNEGAKGRRPWNASVRNIIGFTFVVTGETNGLRLRAVFTTSPRESDEDPMLDLAGPGTYDVLFDYVVYPGESERAGEPIDPTAIYDAQIMVVGAESAATYDFCLTELRPIYGE